ncbi:DUF92 domain-containing protein, partial [bacterium]|nr:DUF92 domain-containing protein [bacterium]
MHALMDLPGHPAVAVAVNLVIALISYKAKLVDKSGVIAGLIAGILIFIGFGPEGFVLLFTFFVVGSVASKFKISAKKKLGVAQKKSGQRGAAHVLANVSVAAALAAIAILSETEDRYLYLIGFIG